MTTINFSQLIQTVLTFLNKAISWADLNIIHNIGAILKYAGNLVIKMLLFMVGAVKWLVSLI